MADPGLALFPSSVFFILVSLFILLSPTLAIITAVTTQLTSWALLSPVVIIHIMILIFMIWSESLGVSMTASTFPCFINFNIIV